MEYELVPLSLDFFFRFSSSFHFTVLFYLVLASLFCLLYHSSFFSILFLETRVDLVQSRLPHGANLFGDPKKSFAFFSPLGRVGRKQPCVVETIFDCRLNTQAIAVLTADKETESPSRKRVRCVFVLRWENESTLYARSLRRFAYLFYQITRAARVPLIRVVSSVNALLLSMNEILPWTCFGRDATQMMLIEIRFPFEKNNEIENGEVLEAW